MSTTVTSKGQVTIPKRVRDHLGLGPGSAVEFELDADGRVIVRPVGRAAASRRSPVGRVRGRATAGMSTDAIMALTRGER